MHRRVGYQDAVNLTISLCLTYTLFVACVRLWIRKGSYGSDDTVIAVATVVAICHTATDYISLGAGLATPWSAIEQQGNLTTLNKSSIAGVISFIVALYLSKCAMLVFLARITKTTSQIRFYHICNLAVGGVCIVSLLVATVGCPWNTSYYWAFYATQPQCNLAARWQAIAAFDILTELLLLALPVQLVWSLQMPLRKKALIIIAFFLRLPVIGLSIGRNYSTMRLQLPQTDSGLESAIVVIWLEVELAYALAASTLSALKAFTESFNSGFGLGFTRGKGDGSYGMSNVSGNSNTPSGSKSEKAKNASQLESGVEISRICSPPPPPAITKDSRKVVATPLSPTTSRRTPEPTLKLRPEHDITSVTRVSAEPFSGEPREWRENSSAGSDGSANDDMVIMRETGYEVHHDCVPILSK